MVRPRALLAVKEGEGLQGLAAGLIELGLEVVVSGPQGRALAEAGLRIIPVEFATREVNLLDGRLETLHPTILAGIAARRQVARDMEGLRRMGVAPVELVAARLPTDLSLLGPGETGVRALAEGVEMAWAAMLRAAIANWQGVLVLVDPADFEEVTQAMKTGAVSAERRRALAVKAMAHVAAFDALASQLFTGEAGPTAQPAPSPPRRSWVTGKIRAAPPQTASGPAPAEPDAPGTDRPPDDATDVKDGLVATVTGGSRIRSSIAGALPAIRYADVRGLFAVEAGHRVLTDVPTTVESLIDADLGWSMVRDLSGGYAAALVRHGRACSLAQVQESASRAMARAIGSDPSGAVDGTIVTSTRVDLTCARALKEHIQGARLATLVAPDFDEEALALLREGAGLRLVAMHDDTSDAARRILSPTRFGLLLREMSGPMPALDALEPLGQRPLPAELVPAARIAVSAARHTVSAAVAIADATCTTAICGGQAHVMDAVQIAVAKSRRYLGPLVLATDTPLTHPDAFRVLARSQVKAVVQPSTPDRDPAMVQAADGVDIALLGLFDGWHRV